MDFPELVKSSFKAIEASGHHYIHLYPSSVDISFKESYGLLLSQSHVPTLQLLTLQAQVLFNIKQQFTQWSGELFLKRISGWPFLWPLAKH